MFLMVSCIITLKHLRANSWHSSTCLQHYWRPIYRLAACQDTELWSVGVDRLVVDCKDFFQLSDIRLLVLGVTMTRFFTYVPLLGTRVKSCEWTCWWCWAPVFNMMMCLLIVDVQILWFTRAHCKTNFHKINCGWKVLNAKKEEQV